MIRALMGAKLSNQTIECDKITDDAPKQIKIAISEQESEKKAKNNSYPGQRIGYLYAGTFARPCRMITAAGIL
jgi:hypothetical protein